MNISLSDYMRNNLQANLRDCFGRSFIKSVEIPDYIIDSLNPHMTLREYQIEAFQYFFTYWEKDFDHKAYKPQLLFHMATGSGKTLIMAGLVLYLYEKGYRNFLFLVDINNVIEKTKNNFINKKSSKYLFNNRIIINNNKVEIKQVDNFQTSDSNNINLCLSSLQDFHRKLNIPQENSITYDDFSDKKIVIISDEAHHVNAATKRGLLNRTVISNAYSNESQEDSLDWETSVMRVFHANDNNVLLEFTATEDFLNPLIAAKYADKIIFDYPLKQFRKDKYSKDIAVIQSDMELLNRALQAVVMSQFRRKLADSIGQDIKPVVMFKSKTTKGNGEFYKAFSRFIKHLSIEALEYIKADATGPLADAFGYFSEKNISFENLRLELQEDFKDDNLLLIDGSDISAQKQQQVNSLEDKDNEFRAVFAVDMLNEGWDVLNLFDIVRLYDTRDSNGVVPGKTTNTEAQLIGRGARYMPFVVKRYDAETSEAIEHRTKRKFDDELDNPLRYLEILHYHSTYNPRYILELKTALVASGIIDDNQIEVRECLKQEFKDSDLYKHGYIYLNKLVKRDCRNEVIFREIIHGDYQVRLVTGENMINTIFAPAEETATVEMSDKRMPLKCLGYHVLRDAINRFDELSFEILKKKFKDLKSIREFIEDDSFLAAIKVTVHGTEEMLSHLSQRSKHYIAIKTLEQVVQDLKLHKSEFQGSYEFFPYQVRNVFCDHRYKVPKGSVYKEEGISMRETNDINLRMDLRHAEWYAYEDNYGTNEEKYLIKYISEMIPRLKEKYDEVYLIRNYKDFKLYNFDNEDALEPDFVMFLKREKGDHSYENLQLFIEAKGSYLRLHDKWKSSFLKKIHDRGVLRFNFPSNRFIVWGMPFFTTDNQSVFEKVMNDCLFKER